jgi:hypothetical protein
VYLRAAFAVDHYPEVVTHFMTDAGLEGAHSDPRCFNLAHLYEWIAYLLRHSAGTRYGESPRSGTTPGIHNVWWTTSACHRSPP